MTMGKSNSGVDKEQLDAQCGAAILKEVRDDQAIGRKARESNPGVDKEQLDAQRS